MAQVPIGDIEKHFWLTRSVARCMGVSFTEAMAEGRMSSHQFAELITGCRAAHCHEKCALWLACQQTRADAAPDFCANADVLNGLR